MPAAEEFGLLLRDKVSSWRAKNAVAIAIKAEELLKEQMNHIVLSAHPRIIYETIEKGSWAESTEMQNFWSGLLASSCTEDGKDESNLIFINVLSQLTSSQALIVKYVCENAKVDKSQGGWIAARPVRVETDFLMALTNIDDEHRIDRELDHLREVGLMHGGFDPYSQNAELTPSAICLHFFARAQGYVGSPLEFYNVGDKCIDDIAP